MATQAKKVASSSRAKRKLRIRQKISGTDAKPRLSVFRSSKHTYAQVVSDTNHKTLVSASTLDKDVKERIAQLAGQSEGSKDSAKSVLAAKAVGLVLAERAKGASVSQVVFDRNGFLYTGRVKALADGAREGGLTL
jgi:large subunit ribosomal protein L18